MKAADPVFEALVCFQKVTEKINEDLGGKVETRSRTVPILIEDSGLVPTITFLMAKSDFKTFQNMLKFLSGEAQDIKPIEGESEKYAYAVYLALLYHYLLKTGFAEAKDGNLENMIKDLRNLRRNSAVITKILMPYLLELKKLFEAKYGKNK